MDTSQNLWASCTRLVLMSFCGSRVGRVICSRVTLLSCFGSKVKRICHIAEILLYYFLSKNFSHTVRPEISLPTLAHRRHLVQQDCATFELQKYEYLQILLKLILEYNYLKSVQMHFIVYNYVFL